MPLPSPSTPFLQQDPKFDPLLDVGESVRWGAEPGSIICIE
jgi:hypothetical protein